MLRLRLRGSDGKFISGDMKRAREQIDLFGENVVLQGKNILRFFKKEATGNLKRDYKFNAKYTKNGADMNLSFGKAFYYWRFIDEGVRGAGGATSGGKRGGTGAARGLGSRFKFGLKQPPLRPILAWVKKKGISSTNQRGIAFAIALSIKRRGLVRTQFVSKPIEDQFKKLPEDVIKGMAIDLEKLLEKLPDPMEKMTITLTA
jgi:hypothetical protein